MATITLKRPSDGQTITIDENSVLKNHYLGQGWVISNNNENNNQNNQTNQNNQNGSVLFSAYGYTVYSNATKSLITAPDGSGKKAVKWTNPDGSYVWETIDGDNVKNYASQYYQSQESSETSSNDINSLYQKYFSRDATSAEINEWKTQSTSNLETQLKKDYKTASGIDYDGSPIKPGNQKTENQLKTTKATLYGPNGTSEIVDVGSARASELQSQGWGLTAGSYKAPTTENNQITTKATLSSPDGKYKVEVTTGSTEASTLQSKGWTVGATGTSIADLNTALNYSPTTTNNETTSTTDKTIYKRGNDLYTKQGDKFYKIPNTDTLYDLVANKGYNDARTALPSGAIIATSSEEPTSEPEDKNIYKQGNDLFIKRGDTFYKIPDTATLKDYVFNKGYIDSRLDLPTDATTTTIGSETAATAEIPDDLANDPYFMQLDENNKAIVSYYYNTLASQNTEKAKAFTTALDLASKQADPYWKEKLNIVKDELERTTATTEADLVSREKTLMDRQNAINEDLVSNKEYLTAEQQAELARQAESYNNDLTTIREQMASSGLSSSSIRNRAENRLATSNTDVIESATRAYEKNIKDTENTATRELASIAQQTADYQRQALENKTSAARTAEANIGSEALADTSVAPLLLGGISGTMLDSKGTDILNRAKSLMENNS